MTSVLCFETRSSRGGVLVRSCTVRSPGRSRGRRSPAPASRASDAQRAQVEGQRPILGLGRPMRSSHSNEKRTHLVVARRPGLLRRGHRRRVARRAQHGLTGWPPAAGSRDSLSPSLPPHQNIQRVNNYPYNVVRAAGRNIISKGKGQRGAK